MGKMHELLAVETDIVGRANSILEETADVFRQKSVEFYSGYSKKYTPFEEGDKDLVADENKELVDTVPDKIVYTLGMLKSEYDFLAQKEATNQVAKADLQVNGAVIAKDLPATFLLAMEKRLAKLRAVISLAPTLPTGFVWVKDDKNRPFVWKLSEMLRTFRTKKIKKPISLAKATQQHPEQVQLMDDTIVIGHYDEMKWDSRLTSQQKHELLGRVDTLLTEVRKAVRRANDVEASTTQVGEAFTKYILGDTFQK
jgi:hypothetical protein